VIHYYPLINNYDIVFLSIPVDTELTFASIIESSAGYFIVYGLWLFVSTLTWYMHDYWRQQELIKDTLQKQLETELSFLKNQINPHFLFNTLNNLYALALQKSDDAPGAILKLSSILRYILYESDTPTMSFEKEKEIMQAYIELELLRLSDKEGLRFDIMTDKSYELPPLLWLPVLENVFKHGTRTISEKTPVEFHFEIRNNRLSVYSRNDVKMLVGSNEQRGGVGLNNLKKRLELLYPEKHSFETRSENNFYITQIQIDLS